MKKLWTPQEIDTLRQLHPKKTVPEIAAILGRSPRAVYMKAFDMGLRKEQPSKINLDSHQRAWLRREFPRCANIVCATILGISPRSVVRLAREMGLSKSPQFMREAIAKAADRAKRSHILNGTYPPRGVLNDNLAKGAPYRFKPSRPHNQARQ